VIDDEIRAVFVASRITDVAAKWQMALSQPNQHSFAFRWYVLALLNWRRHWMPDKICWFFACHFFTLPFRTSFGSFRRGCVIVE
jgi:hypothetical protein